MRSIENLVSKVFSYGADFLEQTTTKTVNALSSAASKLVVIGLLTLALGGATSIGGVAGKINEMAWLKNAVEIVQKQIDKLAKE